VKTKKERDEPVILSMYFEVKSLKILLINITDQQNILPLTEINCLVLCASLSMKQLELDLEGKVENVIIKDVSEFPETK
jgi:hypothetical protein